VKLLVTKDQGVVFWKTDTTWVTGAIRKKDELFKNLEAVTLFVLNFSI
jgi:hypothetical protein